MRHLSHRPIFCNQIWAALATGTRTDKHITADKATVVAQFVGLGVVQNNDKAPGLYFIGPQMQAEENLRVSTFYKASSTVYIIYMYRSFICGVSDFDTRLCDGLSHCHGGQNQSHMHF